MKIYDISMEIHENMPVYNNLEEKKPKIEVKRDFETSNGYESKIEMDMHTGTHLDMPLHMIEGGKTLDYLDLYKVVTKCKVFDFTDVDSMITQKELESKKIEEGDFIILKTNNAFADDVDFEFIYLEKSGAKYLADKNIKGVGIDALGIERSQKDHATHNTILEKDIVIVEGLSLRDVKEGEYLFIGAPLKIKGVEAAPLRALLIEDYRG